MVFEACRVGREDVPQLPQSIAVVSQGQLLHLRRNVLIVQVGGTTCHLRIVEGLELAPEVSDLGSPVLEEAWVTARWHQQPAKLAIEVIANGCFDIAVDEGMDGASLENEGGLGDDERRVMVFGVGRLAMSELGVGGEASVDEVG